jgi:hypothetical protein
MPVSLIGIVHRARFKVKNWKILAIINLQEWGLGTIDEL